MNQNIKKLYRSRTDRMVSGLCAGLGEYIGIDPTVVRLLFALGTLFLFPAPVIIYFVMMLVVPEDPAFVPVPPVAPVTPPTDVILPPRDVPGEAGESSNNPL